MIIRISKPSPRCQKAPLSNANCQVSYLLPGNELHFRLKEPDFTTALAIHGALRQRFGTGFSEARDAGTVVLRFADAPSFEQLITTVSAAEQVRVTPDHRARVVINSRTGTVVVGAEVRLSPVALAHAGIIAANFAARDCRDRSE